MDETLDKRCDEEFTGKIFRLNQSCEVTSFRDSRKGFVESLVLKQSK